jgi:hypothetical protein
VTLRLVRDLYVERVEEACEGLEPVLLILSEGGWQADPEKLETMATALEDVVRRMRAAKEAL